MRQKAAQQALALANGPRAGDGVTTTTAQAYSAATGTTCIVCRGEICDALARLGSTKCHFCRGGLPPAMADD
jgi:hypothetical protein